MDQQAPREVLIKQKKKQTVKGELVRAAVLARFKIIELATAGNVPFYVIFYKGAVVDGGPVEKVRNSSFLHQAFQKGMVFEAPHPVLELLSPEHSLTLPNENKLFAQFENHYSNLETAWLLTTLDAFFEKDELIEKIHQIYGQLKRDGKHFKAFQILHKLREFAPDAAHVQHQFLSPEFYAFQEMYNDASSLRDKDPLYYEQQAFENRSTLDNRNQLIKELKGQNRELDGLLLWLEAAEEQPSDSVLDYTEIALQWVTMDAWIRILSKTRVNPFQQLPKAKTFIESIIKKGEHEEAVTLLLPFINELPDSFHPILKSLWDHLSPAFTADHLEELIPALKQAAITPVNEKPFNRLLFQLTAHLLQKNELEVVQEKLAPVKRVFPGAAALRKIDQMAASSEDPDRMMQLGKDYAEFGQYDQAIECFSLAMEFHPEDPSSIWHMSKMYQQKGLVKEAEAYQQYYSELKKSTAN